MPAVSTMKPEPSELVLRGCMPPPPPLSPPGPPRRFLKKSSKNSSNGEPGGSCGIAPLSPPPPPALASTVCEVEILTTASITFSATSAMPSGPRASAGAEIRTLAAPSQIAATSGRKRRLWVGMAAVMSASLFKNRFSDLAATVRPNRVAAQVFAPDIPPKNRPQWLTIALIALDFPPIVSQRTLAANPEPEDFSTPMRRIAPVLAPDEPYQDQAGDRRSDADDAQNVVRRRQCALHGPAHPGRTCREQQAFKHEQDTYTDEEVGERYGPHRTETSGIGVFLFLTSRAEATLRFGPGSSDGCRSNCLTASAQLPL